MKHKEIYLYIIIFAILAWCIVNLFGCNSLSIAKHKKIAWNMGYWIEEVEMLTIEKCNNNELSEADCDKILGENGYVNVALDAYESYVAVIFGVQNGKDPQEKIVFAFKELMDAFAVLAKDAVALKIIDEDKIKSLGIKID